MKSIENKDQQKDIVELDSTKIEGVSGGAFEDLPKVTDTQFSPNSSENEIGGRI